MSTVLSVLVLLRLTLRGETAVDQVYDQRNGRKPSRYLKLRSAVRYDTKVAGGIKSVRREQFGLGVAIFSLSDT